MLYRGLVPSDKDLAAMEVGSEPYLAYIRMQDPGRHVHFMLWDSHDLSIVTSTPYLFPFIDAVKQVEDQDRFWIEELVGSDEVSVMTVHQWLDARGMTPLIKEVQQGLAVTS